VTTEEPHTPGRFRIIAISGSLRAASSNTAMLEMGARLAPEGVDLVLWGGLDALPHFNPDIEQTGSLPLSVTALRATLCSADALIVSTPEYAHGLPGSFKNMLDWMVGDLDFAGMPVAIWNPTQRAEFAPAQLREILRTMAARIIDEASLGLIRLAEDAPTSAQVCQALLALAAVKRHRLENGS
jgi:chromate reductase, NAD(P)H dehydrogenase (quinone)